MAIFVRVLVVLKSRSFFLVIDAKVAILADPFGVKSAIVMFTFEGFLSSSLGVIAVLAHSVGVVWHIIMATLSDLVSVLLFLYTLCFMKRVFF